MKYKIKKITRKFRYNKKRSTFFLFLLLLVCSIGLGYAAISTTLSIDGTAEFKDARWDIHFDNLNVTSGSVTATTAASITNTTTVSFAARLENPGDFYEFTVDVVNGGNMNAMIESVNVLPELTAAQQNYLSYTVTYSDGVELAPYQKLDAGDIETLIVRFEYLENADATLYPTEDDNLTIAFDVTYVQADSNQFDAHIYNCTYNGELVQGAEFVDGQYTYRYKQHRWNDPGEGVTPISWYNVDTDGWSVVLTDMNSTAPVTSRLCTSINGKPIVSLNYAFYESKAPSIDLRSFDTSNVIEMHATFYMSSASTINVSNFDTSNVIDMESMFRSENLTNIIGLNSFNTSNVENMHAMFYTSKVGTIDISSFNTEKVVDMDYMFSGMDITNFVISNFDTRNVESMHGMFYNFKTTSLNLSSFNTSKVQDMAYMFSGSEITNLNVSNFNTSSVTNMYNMFNTAKIQTLDLSSFDMSGVTNTDYMFNNTTATTGYAKSQADADRLNATVGKPTTLTFVVQ